MPLAFGIAWLKMKTLSEWNDMQYQYTYARMQNQPLPAGVACDTCGNEMLQESNASILASYPPKIHVWCVCGKTAYKVI